jgi:hypothetical protein
MHEIISRKDAKAAGDRYYFTGRPCKRGHIELRYVSDKNCCICARQAAEKFRNDNPTYSEEWRQANLEQYNERKREWLAANPGYMRRWLEANKERVIANNKKWVAENYEKRLAIGRRYTSKRRRAVQNQESKLAPLEQLELNILFEEAALLGPGWHVDHIVPLCAGGEHRPYNMQIVRDRYNVSKNAKLWYTPADLGKHLPAHYAEAAM